VRSPWLSRLAAGAAVLLAGLVYLNALDNPFVYDDRRLIVENRALRPPINLHGLVLHDVSRPVVNLSYALDRVIWGPAPFGFHLTNVVLHMINVGLLFGLARRETGRLLAAFLAAAIFAVHPMMTQAVGYVSGRAEVISATFFLLAFGAARRWMRGGPARWLAATFGLWLLALGSKETAVVFPLVLLAYDRFVLTPRPGAVSLPDRRSRLVWLHAPLIGVAGVAVAVRLAVFTMLEHPGAIDINWSLGLVELDVARRYLALLFAPREQAIFHELAPITGLLDPRVLLSLAVLGVLAAIAWWTRRVEGIITVGIALFFLALLPSAALVILDRGEPMAEQRVYLAGAGLFLAFGAALARLESWRRWSARPFARLLAGAIAVAILGILSMHTLLRNAMWGSPLMLFTEAADRAPGSWHAHLLLGEAMHNAGRHNEAIWAFTVAIRGQPEEPSIYGKVGICLIEVGETGTAKAAFEKLRELSPRSPEGSNGFGALALMAGQAERARALYEESLLYDPLNVPARLGLAKIEELEGNAAAALRRCEEIRDLAPETPGNDECLSRNRARLGRGGSAPR
jgi:tetratricopeptide (TPR) repeat protein